MKKITSPLPGVFYRRPAPDQEVFVNEGDKVNAGDTIGLIEIMKIYYEVKVDEPGVIDEFLVNNATIVNVGEDLVILK